MYFIREKNKKRKFGRYKITAVQTSTRYEGNFYQRCKIFVRQRDERDDMSRLKWDYSVSRRCDRSSHTHTERDAFYSSVVLFFFFLFCSSREYNGKNSKKIFTFKVYVFEVRQENEFSSSRVYA